VLGARDLLETGRKDVLTRLAGQPRLQAELLRGIAKIQGDMGEYASADGTYAELVKVFAALHEPKQEALARADHAYNAFQMANPSLASTLLRQGTQVRGRPSNDAELDARFSEIEGLIAISQGGAASARKELESARLRAAESLGINHLRTFRLGQALLLAEGQLRHFDAALALRAQLRESASLVAGIDSNEAAAMDWDQAKLLRDAGRFQQALALVETALPACIASLGPEEQYCRLLLISRGNLLLRLGLFERAIGDQTRFAALSDDEKWPFVRIEAMVLQLRLASRFGPAPELSAMAERLRVFGQSNEETAVNPVFKATALLALAESSLLLGEPRAAQRWVEQALEKLGEGVKQHTNMRFSALAREMMGVSMLYQGRSDLAMSSFTEAQSRFVESFGPEHAMTHLMGLNIALTYEAMGQPLEALAIVVRSQPILEPALGSESPLYKRIQALRKRLEEKSRTQQKAELGSRPQGTRSALVLPPASEFFS
jgi:hypothetical protein